MNEKSESIKNHTVEKLQKRGVFDYSINSNGIRIEIRFLKGNFHCLYLFLRKDQGIIMAEKLIFFLLQNTY